MLRLSRWLVWFSLGASGLLAAANSKPLEVADFVRPPLFGSPAINFDGTRVAALSAKSDGRTSLLLYEVKARKAQIVRPAGVHDVFRFAWLDDTHVIFNLAQENRYAHGLYVLDVRQPDRRVNINWGDSVRFVGAPRRNPLQPIVWLRMSSDADGRDDGLVQYDGRQSFNANVTFSDDYYGPPNTGANIVRRLPAPTDVALGFTADRFGEPAYARTTKDGRETLWHWRQERWEKCAVDLEAMDLAGDAGFGAELLLLARRSGEHPRGAQRYDWVGEKLGPVLVRDAHCDILVDKIHQRETTGEIVGLNYTTTGPRSVWFDDELAALQASVEAQLPGMTVRCAGFDRGETRFLFHAFSDRHPGRFYLFDRATRELVLIANAAPWIVPEQMCPTQLVQFKARDGMELDGLLTLPTRNEGGAPPPAVVIPSSSPNDPLSWGWDETAQFLAHRGYAVFRPNHRGATIYGWKTKKGAEWDFLQMHRDVTDGVKAMMQSGLIDRARLAILGREFGAFLAVCGGAYEQDLYCAVVGVAGTYDWASAAKDLGSDIAFRGRYATLRRYLGDPSKATAAYAAISLPHQIAQAKAAFLIARGEMEEGPGSITQSRRLIAALKAANKTVETVTAEGIDPAFYSAENQLKLLKAVDAFLARHLPRH